MNRCKDTAATGLGLFLLLLFGFFDGFAEVGDGRDFGGLEDVLALRAPADVAVDGLGACGASHVGSGAVAGTVDDEAVVGDRGTDFGLLFGASVLRKRLVGGAGCAAFLAAEANGVVGLLHGDRAVVGGEVADGAINRFASAFADDDDEVGAAGLLDELEAPPTHEGFFNVVLCGFVAEWSGERSAGVGIDDDADGACFQDEVGDLGFLFGGDGEGEKREKNCQERNARANGHGSLRYELGGRGEYTLLEVWVGNGVACRLAEEKANAEALVRGYLGICRGEIGGRPKDAGSGYVYYCCKNFSLLILGEDLM